MWAQLKKLNAGKIAGAGIFNRFNSRFIASENGNVAVIGGILAIPLMAVVGVTVDYSNIAREKSDLQEISDAAALYAVKDVKKRGTTELEFERKAEDSLTSNYEQDSKEVTLDLDLKTQKMTVDMSKMYQTAFMGIMGTEEVKIAVHSEVTYSFVYTDPRCIYTLGERGKASLKINGNGAINAAGCSIQVNSEDDDATILNGQNSSIDAETVCIVGGVGKGNDNIDAEVIEGCAEQPDPFAALDQPSVGSCDYDGTVSVSKGQATIGKGKKAKVIATESSDGYVHLSPGVYCGGIDIGDDTNVFLDKESGENYGFYVFKDGSFNLTSSGALTGDDVILYFTGNNIDIDFSGQGKVDLKAPSADDLAGSDYEDYANFVIYFDPDDAEGTKSKMAGQGSSNYEGIVYLGEGELEITGNGALNSDSPYSIIIAEEVVISGNAVLTVGVVEEDTDLDIPEDIFDTEVVAYLSK